MCLAIPAKVVAITQDRQTATVSLDGVRKDISLALVADAEIDDYVLVHVGYALNKIDPEEAQKTLDLMAELSEVPQ